MSSSTPEGDTATSSDAFPVEDSAYTIAEQIGFGGSATVFRAICEPLQREVAVKMINLEETKVLLDVIRKEIMTLGLSDHENVVKFYTSFLVEDKLWLVMDYMAAGSVLDIMKFKFQGGLEETQIATVMREALKGIKYFHDTERIHRDVKAGNILISSAGDVKLADLGVAAWLMADGERKDLTKTFVGTPCWMAPEVMEQTTGHSYSADIWSFGITALELAHGQVPFAHLKPMKVLLTVLKEPPPSLEPDEMKARGWSKSFKEMIDACLQKDPAKRIATNKLLEHRFFKQAKKPDYIAMSMVAGLPPLGTRFKHQQALQKEKFKEDSNAIPADDLADPIDDVEPWDFGEHAVRSDDASGDDDEDDEDDDEDEEEGDEGESKSARKKKKKTSDDDDDTKSRRKKHDADDDAADSGDDTIGKSRRKKKVAVVVDADADAPEQVKRTKTRKGSRAGVEEEGGDGEVIGKKGRFSILKKTESTRSTKEKSRKSRDIRVNDECESCALLKAQLAALRKENKELMKRLSNDNDAE